MNFRILFVLLVFGMMFFTRSAIAVQGHQDFAGMANGVKIEDVNDIDDFDEVEVEDDEMEEMF